MCYFFFRLFVTTFIFRGKQRVVAQDARAIIVKEKERGGEGWRKKLEGRSLHACKRTSRVARYLHSRKREEKKGEKESDKQGSRCLCRARLFVLSLRLWSRQATVVSYTKNTCIGKLWPCSVDQVSANRCTYRHRQISPASTTLHQLATVKKRLPLIVTWLTDQS